MKPKSDEEDSALFREATRGVKPLRPTARVPRETPAPKPRARFSRVARQHLVDDALEALPAGPAPAAGDPSAFARAGVSEATLRKLRRGQFRIEADLDLHGLTLGDATVQLREFLIAILQRHVRCVRIVHGKGLRSGTRGPVLRQLVNGALRNTAPVLAFVSARPVDGGTGAVYVLFAGAPQASSASSTAD